MKSTDPKPRPNSLSHLAFPAIVALAMLFAAGCSNTPEITYTSGVIVGGVHELLPREDVLVDRSTHGGELDRSRMFSLTLHVMGTPQQMGIQHGDMLKDWIHNYLNGYVLPFIDQNGGRDLYDVAAGMLEVPEDYAVEMRGIAEAAEVPYEDILLLNTYLDIASALAGREHRSLPLGGTVVGLTDRGTSGDRGPALARTLHLKGGEGLTPPESILVVAHPPVGKPFCYFGFPGMIGGFTGTNYGGLAVATNAVSSDVGLSNALPTPFLTRRLLEECDTADQAAEEIVARGVALTSTVTLVDTTDNAWCLECTPGRVAVRQTGEKVKTAPSNILGVISGNHFADDDLMGLQNSPDAGTQTRVAVLSQSLGGLTTGINGEKLVEALSNTSSGWPAAQALIIYPLSQDLWVHFREDPEMARYRLVQIPSTYGVLEPELQIPAVFSR